MKIMRLVTIFIIMLMAFEFLAPAQTAVALSPDKEKTASLTVNNQTGGTLYVSLSGPKAYSFAATSPGKTTFSNITPGKYTITIRTSACGGSLTYSKNLKGKENLKQFVCTGGKKK